MCFPHTLKALWESNNASAVKQLGQNVLERNRGWVGGVFLMGVQGRSCGQWLVLHHLIRESALHCWEEGGRYRGQTEDIRTDRLRYSGPQTLTRS